MAAPFSLDEQGRRMPTYPRTCRESYPVKLTWESERESGTQAGIRESYLVRYEGRLTDGQTA